jgi:hypothetical protein
MVDGDKKQLLGAPTRCQTQRETQKSSHVNDKPGRGNGFVPELHIRVLGELASGAMYGRAFCETTTKLKSVEMRPKATQRNIDSVRAHNLEIFETQ